MNEENARREIQRAYELIEHLKLLANNSRYELDMDDHNLREAIRHLNAYYMEMTETYQKFMAEKLEKEQSEKEKTEY